MKCTACGKNTPRTSWRTLNLSGTTKTTIRGKALDKNKPINYYTVPGKQQYTNIYACPRCGTLKIRTPIDRY